MVKTFLAVVKYEILGLIEYRVDIMLQIFNNLIPFLVELAVVKNIFGTNVINNISASAAMQYLMFAYLISSLTESNFEEYRGREITYGKIDMYLTRPLAYWQEVVYKEIGNRFLQTLFVLPIFAFVYFYLFSTSWHFLDIKVSQITLLLALLLAALVINISISLSITLSTFWLENSFGLAHFKWIVVVIFSGSMLPPALLPSWLQTIIYALPLKYLYYVPIAVMQNQYIWTWRDTLTLFITISAAIGFTFWLEKRAMRQYTSAGG